MLRFSLVDRYVGWEIFKIFLTIVLILVLMLTAGSLVKLLQLAAQGTIGNDVVFTLLGLEILRLAGRLIPASFFISVLFVLGRMYRDNEMTVMCASGIGTFRLVGVVAMVAVPLAAVTAWLSIFLYPSTSYLTHHIKVEQQDAALIAAMDAGRFIESDRGDMVLYAESRVGRDKALRNIFLQQRDGSVLAVVTAAEGRHYFDNDSGQRLVILEEGRRYQHDFDTGKYALLEFGEYGMHMNPVDTQNLRYKYRVWPTRELLKSDKLRARAELQDRLAYPLAVLAFTLLAVPLSRSLPREGMYGRALFAVFIYVVFAGLLQVARTWMLKGVTPPWMGTWWVVALMVLLAGLLFLREAYWVRRLHLLFRQRFA
ncbi:MAG: LPS export ABC transporter permease LptF [Pseudomonadota bacterium]